MPDQATDPDIAARPGDFSSARGPYPAIFLSVVTISASSYQF